MIYYVFLLFFVFDYLRPGNYIPGLDALQLNALVPMTAILGTLVRKTPVSNRQFFAEPNTAILGTLLVLLAISTVFATVTLSAYTVTKNVFAYMLVAYWVCVRQVGDVQRLKGVFLTLTGVHLAVAALNPQLFTNPDSRVGINSGAFLGDGNDFSLSVNICIPLCLFLLLESKRKLGKLLWAAVLVALALAVVATKSRGGTVALGAMMLYFWFFSRRKALTAALFVFVVAVVLAIAPPTYFERMGTIGDTEEGSTAGRLQAWRTGTQMAIRNPILGAGAGHFPMAYGTSNESRWMTAHSIYFLLLGELGLPGITVLLTLIFWNLSANKRLRSRASELPPEQAATVANVLTCTSASLIAYATGGAFLSAAYYPHMYVLAGLLAAGRHVVRDQLEARVREPGDSAAAALAKPVSPALTPGAISPEWVPRPPIGERLYSGSGSREPLR